MLRWCLLIVTVYTYFVGKWLLINKKQLCSLDLLSTAFLVVRALVGTLYFCTNLVILLIGTLTHSVAKDERRHNRSFLVVVELFCILLLMVICLCTCQIHWTVYQMRDFFFTVCKLKTNQFLFFHLKKSRQANKPPYWFYICILCFGLFWHHTEIV